MSLKKFFALFILLTVGIYLSGCATMSKQKDMEIERLKSQVSLLDTQIQDKDQEINSLKEAIKKIQEEGEFQTGMMKKRVVPEVKSRPTTRQIQIALRNFGLNPGRIDGKMGRQTRDAIRQFQRANNLKVDGKVGKKTWDLLKAYLYKKTK